MVRFLNSIQEAAALTYAGSVAIPQPDRSPACADSCACSPVAHQSVHVRLRNEPCTCTVVWRQLEEACIRYCMWTAACHCKDHSAQVDFRCLGKPRLDSSFATRPEHSPILCGTFGPCNNVQSLSVYFAKRPRIDFRAASTPSVPCITPEHLRMIARTIQDIRHWIAGDKHRYLPRLEVTEVTWHTAVMSFRLRRHNMFAAPLRYLVGDCRLLSLNAEHNQCARARWRTLHEQGLATYMVAPLLSSNGSR